MCDTVNLDYLKKTFGKLEGIESVLEVGSKNVNGNSRSFFAAKNVRYVGCDIQEGEGVDILCDISSVESIRESVGHSHYDLILCMNVLEHLFEVNAALVNMKGLLRRGGYILVVVPQVWELHDYPSDFQRLHPDYFREFCRRNAMDVLDGTMVFATRDSRRFFDASVLPRVTHEIAGGGWRRLMLRILGRILPDAAHMWPYVYLNLVMQKK